MAFDKPTRNALARMVGACRQLLKEDTARQLQSRFGLHPDGTVLPLEKLAHLTEDDRTAAGDLRDLYEHFLAGTAGAEKDRRVAAYARMALEISFTQFNRLAALRLAEERGFIQECVRKGYDSVGFRVFERPADGALGNRYETYRTFLELMFDELAVDLPVLFDRRSAHSAVFPSEPCMEAVLAKVNDPDLASLWAEDETIGWIYQYFNDESERKKMREESAAPRNSRELAVRNQFFTPRYVVEFLADNTLGRIWYEMTKGQTRLKDVCRYLVRRPTEVFLGGLCLHSLDSTAPWVRDVILTGDFAAMPESPDWGGIGDLALAIDGYEVAEAKGIGDLLNWFNPLFEAFVEKGTPLPTSALELWFMLFACQRGYLREFDPDEGGQPPFAKAILAIYASLRSVLQNPSNDLPQEELLKQPVFVPHRPIKDPREIRMLDPACGSMHFGLYCFDLYEVIYEEAWARRLISPDEFGAQKPPFPHHSVSLRTDLSAVRSNDTGESVPIQQAMVVVPERGDFGDGIDEGQPYIIKEGRKFRVPFAYCVPLAQFDYQQALRDGWFSEMKGESLVRKTDAFAHRPADAEPADKVQENFRNAIPRLIIENNIHGIDIDPRCAQIAGLSLWLRAHKAWQREGLRPAVRPTVRKSNVVCAEPMPGEKDLLQEFTKTLNPPLLGQIVVRVWDAMQLAGEAGSLLRIEEQIADWVKEAKKQWLVLPKPQQMVLFEESARYGSKTKQEEFPLDLTGISDSTFWDQAEDRIYAAIQAYAQQADAGGNAQRRLFAEDAARGFAFIDVCRKRYDVALMNPPFGDITATVKEYVTKKYSRSKADVLCMFVERTTALLSQSCVCGAITNRTPFFTDGTEAWRESFCLGSDNTAIRLFADLGHKVLDSALVETAAYSLAHTSSQADFTWFSVTQNQDKESSLLAQVRSGGAIAHLSDIRAIPGKRLSYWLPKSAIRCYAALPSLAASVESVDKGMSTTDDFRFIRSIWEIPSAPSPDGWMYYSKGGEYSPFASDVHLAVKWFKGGREMSQVVVAKYPYLKGDAGWVLHPETHHGLAGLTFTKRTTSSFSARFLPAGARVSDLANLVYDSDVEKLLGALVCLSTSPFHYLLDAAVPSIDSSAGGTAARHYEVGTLREVPIPATRLKHYSLTGGKLFRLAQRRYIKDEGSTFFDAMPALWYSVSLRDASVAEERALLKAQLESIELHAQAELSLVGEYGLDSAAVRAVYDYMGIHPNTLPNPQLSELLPPSEVWRQSEEQLTALLVRTYGGKRRYSKQTWIGGREIELWSYVTNRHPLALAQSLSEDESFASRNTVEFALRVLSLAVGCAFGRWDIRYATGEKDALALPDPFAALPVSPPGRLLNTEGLPVRPDDVPVAYPVRIPWAGILVDDSDHPLDLARRIREVIEIIWKDRADAIEHEACELLGVKLLRHYFGQPGDFFADHLKRYSKSRRQAPIYWPLSTASGSYALWVYYHRLTDETLYKCVNDFVDPKIQETTRRLTTADRDLSAQKGGDATRTRDLVNDLRALLSELQDFKAELLRVASLPYKPDLNDGVIINAAPLHKLFRHRKWAKDCEDCWKSLEKGDYDWAHMALNIWPDRVRDVCRRDKSIAIAHDLESLYEGQPEQPKAKGRRKKGKTENAEEL